MIVLTDPGYLDTKLVKQGVKQLDPLFRELVDWLSQKCKTPILNIYYDKIKEDSNRPRLSVIFEYSAAVKNFCDKKGKFKANKQALAADKFTQLVIKAGSPIFDSNRLLVIFTAFEPVAKEEANLKIPAVEIDRLKQTLAGSGIWEIYRELSATTYFFYTDKAIEESRMNGTAEIMKKQYFELLKKYDEFDYFKLDSGFLSFDSRENFDNHFKSSWFNYSRR